MIKIWKIAQGTDKTHCDHQGNNPAIKINISSPAYIFPNNRRPKETGFEISVTPSKIKLSGINAQ